MFASQTPDVVRSTDESSKQEAWLLSMTEEARKNKVEGWEFFVGLLSAVPADEKQGWLEAGVSAHGLNAECKVIIP